MTNGTKELTFYAEQADITEKSSACKSSSAIRGNSDDARSES